MPAHKPVRIMLQSRRSLMAFCCVMACTVGILVGQQTLVARQKRSDTASDSPDSILVSYSYFEKDKIQEDNFRFFLSVGMGIDSIYQAPKNTKFVLVQNGPHCAPCSMLFDQMLEYNQDATDALAPHATAVFLGRPNTALLLRTENTGMDIAAHNITIMHLNQQGMLQKFDYFILLNSSVKGPFYPSWMPSNWQWTKAFTERLTSSVKAVGSSLVCLPALDLGGPGPRLESWAFAVDNVGMDVLIQNGLFQIRSCKVCPDGIVVQGEYALSRILLDHDFNIATLLSMYPRDLDWRVHQHWNCNNNVHPSRHGTYDHITMHPFETVFVKSSWQVGEPFTSHYSKWFLEHGRGASNTQGFLDERMYHYAIGPEAILPHEEALGYYKIARYDMQNSDVQQV